ncbi:pilus assembly protein [Corticibacter populi]|uniref:Pilus assembly protein n=1 Tax=Corticibacter populi TaxID=1550736 RepID=A0A3M6QUT7_9BURK|nr:TadE/TadG family type IV pilus assembly protein [Corticibacter populi]RMX06319.1 pilus assembly protein [Corticibacter populi]RZS32143.1 TadE-like protein [Corticibacter populi]
MTRNAAPSNRRPPRQRGVAAIEFAFIAALMALMLLGLLVYWRVLQAQQSVTRAAGDGARIVQNLIYGALPGHDITVPASIQAAADDVVKRSLQHSGIPGNPLQDTTVTLTVGTDEARLNVSYRLPALFGNTDADPRPIQLGHWALTEPASLQASALVSFTLATGGAP